MSARTRALDQVGRLVGEPPLDTLFIVHRRRWHWPAVAIGFAVALVASLAVGAPWFLALPIAGIGGGFGMNAGTDFRFIARTPTRLLLLASSRVIAKPTRVIRELAPAQVSMTGRWFTRTLLLDGEPHVMATQQAPRLDRMCDAAHVSIPATPKAPTAP